MCMHEKADQSNYQHVIQFDHYGCKITVNAKTKPADGKDKVHEVYRYLYNQTRY